MNRRRSLARHRRIAAALTAIIILVLSRSAAAQEPAESDQPDRTLGAFNEQQATTGGPPAPEGPTALPDPALPTPPPPEILDPATKEKYLAALARYYEYRNTGYDHRQRVFEWQFLSSQIIFYAVLVLVLCGIYFSAIQFHAGLRRRGAGEPAADQTVTEFSASLKGLTVKSPVLGVITLVISLAFFYLYLVFVYPIEDIF